MDLLLKKGGDIESHRVVFDDDEDDFEQGEKIIKTLPTENIIPYFSINVSFEEGYTFEDFFEMLLKYEQLQSVDFFFKEYVAVFEDVKKGKKLREANPDTNDLKSLNVGIAYDVSVSDYDLTSTSTPMVRGNNTYYEMNFTKTPNGKFELDASKMLVVHAIGESVDDDGNQAGDIPYGISFTDVADLLHLPMIMDSPTLTFSGGTEDHSVGDIQFYHHYTDEIGIEGISLYDLVFVIANELCFHGGPSLTNAVKEDLIGRAKECDEDEEIERMKEDTDTEDTDKKDTGE